MLSKYNPNIFDQTIELQGSTKKREKTAHNIVPLMNNEVSNNGGNTHKSSEKKTLSPKHLAPIGPGNTNIWDKKELILSEKTRLKYNVATCTAVDMNDMGVHLLTRSYHDIHGLPGFVHRFLHGRPSLERALFVQAPEMYPIFDTPYDKSKTILMTNPAYLDTKQFLTDCKVSNNYALKRLKDSENGLALVTWYIHPAALPTKFQGHHSAEKVLESFRNKLIHEAEEACKSTEDKQPFDYYRHGPEMTPLARHGSFSKLPRTMSQESISTLETNSDNVYLACLFDLDKNREQSLVYLKSIRKNILSTLETIYGVTPEDKIKLYLHMPYLDATTTLHIHIRVNQADHALEDAKSFGLNEIIATLEQGDTVTNMILSRGTIYCSEYPIGEHIDGVSVKTVPNLKRDWNDIFHLLNAGRLTIDYLLHSLKNEEVKNRMQLLDIDQIEKLLKTIEKDEKFPILHQLIDILKKLDVNKELKNLGWSLESGACNEPGTQEPSKSKEPVSELNARCV